MTLILPNRAMAPGGTNLVVIVDTARAVRETAPCGRALALTTVSIRTERATNAEDVNWDRDRTAVDTRAVREVAPLAPARRVVVVNTKPLITAVNAGEDATLCPSIALAVRLTSPKNAGRVLADDSPRPVRLTFPSAVALGIRTARHGDCPRGSDLHLQTRECPGGHGGHLRA
jgi:hypothetical protein